MAVSVSCTSCGYEVGLDAKFCSNCGIAQTIKSKKHFICTHTFRSEEQRKIYFANISSVLAKDWFWGVTGPRARCIQHWLGSECFWFCHWIAEDEEAIHDLLNSVGADERFITLPVEMRYFVTSKTPEVKMYETPNYEE